jgi:hypothetical protein
LKSPLWTIAPVRKAFTRAEEGLGCIRRTACIDFSLGAQISSLRGGKLSHKQKRPDRLAEPKYTIPSDYFILERAILQS